MTQGTLINHCGGREVSWEELAQIEAPPPTATWYPVPHYQVLAKVRDTLTLAGYDITRQQLSVAKEDKRFFGVLDLSSRIRDGVTLAAGIRNSNDRTFPIGFCVGSRVFTCDNLAFSSEIVISKRHTRFGRDRYEEGIATAVSQLRHHVEAQGQWIDGLRSRELSREEADSIILRSYEEELIGARMLPQLIHEWRKPSYEDFRARNAWSLYNAFTTCLGRMMQAQPAKAALTTIKLQRLFQPEVIDAQYERIEPERHLAGATSPIDPDDLWGTGAD